MKLKDYFLNESSIINEGFDNRMYPSISKPKITLKGKDGKSEIVEFNLIVGPGKDALGWIMLDFIPAGKKNLNILLSLGDKSQAAFDHTADQLVKWVTSKTKLPAEEHYSPRNICRIVINTNSILKKLK